MTSNLSEIDWKSLLRRISRGECTPFLGAGVSHPPLPLGGEIARNWAAQYKYPLADTEDLPRVAQFLAVQAEDDMFPKEEINEMLFSKPQQPDFSNASNPHAMLASLPFPIYITTNYDDFMTQALTQQPNKNPTIELCRWNSFTKSLDDDRFISPDDSTPTALQPTVFHLHGHKHHPRSFVLTEDDYLDFLVNTAKDTTLIPDAIRAALKYNSLMFIGYSLRDLNFRVMYRGLIYEKENVLRQISVTVQLPRTEQPEAATYLEKYFKEIDCKVYWGTADDFVAELSDRWKKMQNG